LIYLPAENAGFVSARRAKRSDAKVSFFFKPIQFRISKSTTGQQLKMENIIEKIAESRRTGEIEFFIKERNDDYVISTMPIKRGILNPFGTVQAGAMLWFADVTATVLALGKAQIHPDGKGFPLAINLHTSLLDNQREGELTAEARFVRSGKRVTVVRTRVTGNRGRLLAEVTTTHVPAA
jgi:1,4-dihydroxy-2-naphthoyl-CoA hydrolase